MISNNNYYFVWSWQIDPLHDLVTWYKIAHAGMQVAQWDFQNKATRTSPPWPCFVLEVCPRVCDVVHVNGLCQGPVGSVHHENTFVSCTNFNEWVNEWQLYRRVGVFCCRLTNRPFAAKPSRNQLFIKLWAATLRMPEMEKACQKHQNGQVWSPWH